jgi:hypothetical protein
MRSTISHRNPATNTDVRCSVAGDPFTEELIWPIGWRLLFVEGVKNVAEDKISGDTGEA